MYLSHLKYLLHLNYLSHPRTVFADLAPKCSGLILVVALHLGAGMALLAGLNPKLGAVRVPDFIVKTIVDSPVQYLPPLPPNVDFTPNEVKLTEPTFTVASATDTGGIHITETRAEPQPVVAKVAPSAAQSPSRGLSAPAYPSDAKKLGEQGAVGLALYLNEKGRVQNAQVETSSGFSRLDEAALQHAVKAWQFIPCALEGKPVACWHKIKFRFQLKDAD